MRSILLEAAIKPLLILQILLAIVLLLRGHNAPGGGFIAGLVASAAVAYIAIAAGTIRARAFLRRAPMFFVSAGWMIAIGSGLVGLAFEAPFLTGIWLPNTEIAGLEMPALGTPLLFDIGVFFIVFGVACEFTLTLFETRVAPEER